MGHGFPATSTNQPPRAAQQQQRPFSTCLAPWLSLLLGLRRWIARSSRGIALDFPSSERTGCHEQRSSSWHLSRHTWPLGFAFCTLARLDRSVVAWDCDGLPMDFSPTSSTRRHTRRSSRSHHSQRARPLAKAFERCLLLGWLWMGCTPLRAGQDGPDCPGDRAGCPPCLLSGCSQLAPMCVCVQSW